jgi:hypothetical protein
MAQAGSRYPDGKVPNCNWNDDTFCVDWAAVGNRNANFAIARQCVDERV